MNQWEASEITVCSGRRRVDLEGGAKEYDDVKEDEGEGRIEGVMEC